MDLLFIRRFVDRFPFAAYLVDGGLSCITYAGNTFVIEPVVWTAENAKQARARTDISDSKTHLFGDLICHFVGYAALW